jgi:hypothetical protein
MSRGDEPEGNRRGGRRKSDPVPLFPRNGLVGVTDDITTSASRRPE